jgi:hypothetical protein
VPAGTRRPGRGRWAPGTGSKTRTAGGRRGTKRSRTGQASGPSSPAGDSIHVPSTVRAAFFAGGMAERSLETLSRGVQTGPFVLPDAAPRRPA